MHVLHHGTRFLSLLTTWMGSPHRLVSETATTQHGQTRLIITQMPSRLSDECRDTLPLGPWYALLVVCCREARLDWLPRSPKQVPLPPLTQHSCGVRVARERALHCHGVELQQQQNVCVTPRQCCEPAFRLRSPCDGSPGTGGRRPSRSAPQLPLIYPAVRLLCPLALWP